MEEGLILDQINRYYSVKRDAELTEDIYWNRFVKFVGYRGCIVLKNMGCYSKSVGTYLIMFNHLVEQFRRGLFSLSNK